MSIIQDFSTTIQGITSSRQVILSYEIAMDVMWLERTPIMHIVDTHTASQNAVVLRGKKPEDLWRAFMACWATVYAGYLATIRLDQESVFAAEPFRNLVTEQGIILQFSGAESHNSIGSGETYHASI